MDKKHYRKLKNKETGLWYSRKTGGFSEPDASKAEEVTSGGETNVRFCFDALGDKHDEVETHPVS